MRAGAPATLAAAPRHMDGGPAIAASEQALTRLAGRSSTSTLDHNEGGGRDGAAGPRPGRGAGRQSRARPGAVVPAGRVQRPRPRQAGRSRRFAVLALAQEGDLFGRATALNSLTVNPRRHRRQPAAAPPGARTLRRRRLRRAAPAWSPAIWPGGTSNSACSASAAPVRRGDRARPADPAHVTALAGNLWKLAHLGAASAVPTPRAAFRPTTRRPGPQPSAARSTAAGRAGSPPTWRGHAGRRPKPQRRFRARRAKGRQRRANLSPWPADHRSRSRASPPGPRRGLALTRRVTDWHLAEAPAQVRCGASTGTCCGAHSLALRAAGERRSARGAGAPMASCCQSCRRPRRRGLRRNSLNKQLEVPRLVTAWLARARARPAARSARPTSGRGQPARAVRAPGRPGCA